MKNCCKVVKNDVKIDDIIEPKINYEEGSLCIIIIYI